MSRYYDYYRKITVNEGTQEACLMLFTVITSKLVQDVKSMNRYIAIHFLRFYAFTNVVWNCICPIHKYYLLTTHKLHTLRYRIDNSLRECISSMFTFSDKDWPKIAKILQSYTMKRPHHSGNLFTGCCDPFPPTKKILGH